MQLITTSLRLIILLTVLSALPAYGQDAKLRIEHLDKFNNTAAEMVDVTVDEKLLQLAAKFLRDNKPDEAKVKELIMGLKGVFVKRFGFDQEGQFTDADVEPIRAQLRSPAWSRIVGVRSRKKTIINVDVYLMSEGSVIKGLAVLAIEPKALTVVNVVGPIDLEKLSQLEGKFGIPAFDLMQGKGVSNKVEDDEKPARKPEPDQPEKQDDSAVKQQTVEKPQDDTVIKNLRVEKTNDAATKEKTVEKKPSRTKRSRRP